MAITGLWDGLAAQVTAAGFTLRRDDCRLASGRTDYTARTVTVRADVTDAQGAKTLAHELAHVLMHDGTAHALGCRGLVEVEAESVADVVRRRRPSHRHLLAATRNPNAPTI